LSHADRDAPERRLEATVFLLVSAANLAPIWAFRYFAGQDTPNHLYGGEILRVLLDGSAPPQVAHTFAVALGVKSNLSFHVLLLALTHLGLSIELAHRVLLSAYALMWPLAAMFCVRTAAPGSRPLGLLFLPLTWNWFVLQGLYNYVLSLIPALVWLGLLARDGGRPRRWSALALAVSAAAVFFSHSGTYLALCLVSFLRVAVDDGDTSLRARLWHAGPLWRALAPSLALAGLAAWSCFGWAGPVEPSLARWETYDLPMALGAFVVEFAMRYQPLDLVALTPPLLVLAGLPLGAAWSRRRRSGVARARGEPARWPLVAALALTALYLVLPHVAFGSDASPRLRPLIIFCLICYGGVSLSRRGRRLIVALALASGLASAALLGWSFSRLNPELDDFTSGVALVPRGARLYPMVFEPRAPSMLVKPFLHAWGYYGVARDVVSPFAFAWHPTRFPYRYRELPLHARDGGLPSDSEDEPSALTDGRLCASVRRDAPSLSCDEVRRDAEDRLLRLGGHYDYVLTWRAPADFLQLLLTRGFRPVHGQGSLMLYQTPAPPPAS
jgi:hypothetical protein